MRKKFNKIQIITKVLNTQTKMKKKMKSSNKEVFNLSNSWRRDINIWSARKLTWAWEIMMQSRVNQKQPQVRPLMLL